jgi:hypothetical protein
MGVDMDTDMDDSNQEDSDEVVTFKTIQKLTGKLGQKIRTFLSDEENEMSSKDIKYVINSVLSALNLDSLDEEDREEIVSKFEGMEDDDMGMEDDDMGMEDDDMGMEDDDMGMESPEPPQPEGEMAEYEDFMNKQSQKDLVSSFFTEEDDFEDDLPRFRRPGGSRTPSKIRHNRGMSEEESYKMEEMIEGLFTESKVENVLKKYFKIDERERILMEESKKSKILSEDEKIKIRQKIKNLSENISQEVASIKFLKKHPNSKLLGKNNNNGCLVFESHNKTFKVTPKGNII